ncbi:MAG TPA: hypothetical protein PKG84_00505 [Novosphingobium sp.]|nr:hypothetical protein [Novosphingobium sp.]
MIARMGSGWQTVLADLSMILFMVTAAGVSQSPPEPPPTAAQPPQTPALGEPVALWRDETGAPTLGQWLALHPDPRLRLTIIAPAEQAEAALALAHEAGRPARVVLEPGRTGLPLAALTYDLGETAHPLQPGGDHSR